MGEHVAGQNLRLYQNQLSYLHEVLVFSGRRQIVLGKTESHIHVGVRKPLLFFLSYHFSNGEIIHWCLNIHRAGSIDKRESRKV